MPLHCGFQPSGAGLVVERLDSNGVNIPREPSSRLLLYQSTRPTVAHSMPARVRKGLFADERVGADGASVPG